MGLFDHPHREFVQKPKYPVWGWIIPRPELVKFTIDLREADDQEPPPATGEAGLFGTEDWVQKPKFPEWGWTIPRPELVRFDMDLRKDEDQARPQSNQFLLGRGQSGGVHGNSQPERPSPQHDTQRSGMAHDRGSVILFGSSRRASDRYSGGPILNKWSGTWQPTYYTKPCGAVVHKKDDIQLPFNIAQIVRSVAVMSTADLTVSQSAVWVGPRLLLSTLHLQAGSSGVATEADCEAAKNHAMTEYCVEGEITVQLLSSDSPKVCLVDYSIDDDIGLFRLDRQYPARTDWVHLDWLIERDVSHSLDPQMKPHVACVAYSGGISAADTLAVQKQLATQMPDRMPNAPSSGSHALFHSSLGRPAHQITSRETYMDLVSKAGMRCLASGTLDKAEADEQRVTFGVACSLWNGSSGGPCVLLDGPEEGGIIGLVRGSDGSGPFNLVNGLPAGLKTRIKGLQLF